jgi:CRP-like cAMP-binding protein
LLGALSSGDFAALGVLEAARLDVKQVIEARGQRISHVYFVETGMVSVVGVTAPNHRIEIAMIGSEGMTGAGALLGDTLSVNEIIVQSSGQAVRLSVDGMRGAMASRPTLAAHFLRYVQAFVVQASQTALANGRGRLDERLARWLLMWQDRLRKDELVVTHEFLALLLGVRRAGVTVALHELEGAHLIKASRTLIRVLDRTGLRDLANGFYGVAEAEYDRLMDGGAPVGVAAE